MKLLEQERSIYGAQTLATMHNFLLWPLVFHSGTGHVHVISPLINYHRCTEWKMMASWCNQVPSSLCRGKTLGTRSNVPAPVLLSSNRYTEAISGVKKILTKILHFRVIFRPMHIKIPRRCSSSNLDPQMPFTRTLWIGQYNFTCLSTNKKSLNSQQTFPSQWIRHMCTLSCVNECLMSHERKLDWAESPWIPL